MKLPPITLERLEEIEKRALAATDTELFIEPLTDGKHYGTRINCREFRNPIVVFGTEEAEYPEDDAAHSKRETQKVSSHWPLGGHYESVRDLANAELIIHARTDILDLVRQIRWMISEYEEE